MLTAAGLGQVESRSLQIHLASGTQAPCTILHCLLRNLIRKVPESGLNYTFQHGPWASQDPLHHLQALGLLPLLPPSLLLSQPPGSLNQLSPDLSWLSRILSRVNSGRKQLFSNERSPNSVSGFQPCERSGIQRKDCLPHVGPCKSLPRSSPQSACLTGVAGHSRERA